MDRITVVGAGIAGLTAAITCAEQGAPVLLLEAHEQLGGRARSLPGPYKANLGPHALLSSSPFWRWLGERDLLPGRRAPAAVGRPLPLARRHPARSGGRGDDRGAATARAERAGRARLPHLGLRTTSVPRRPPRSRGPPGS